MYQHLEQDAMLEGMIHDLRNQVQVITNVSQVLADGPSASQEQKKWITALHQTALLATRQVNLLLNHQSSHDFNSAERYFKIRDVIQMVEQGMLPTAEDKNLAFEVRVDEEVPVVLWGDSLYLSQILLNLLRNAFEYTPAGGKVSLELRPTSIDETYSTISFVISDTGPGLPEVVMHNLGQPYIGVSSVEGGMGLGLFMVKKWVEMLGGHMQTTNTHPNGLRIELSIPFERLIGQAHRNSEDFDMDILPFTILIVEDNSLSLEAMSKIIQKNFSMAEIHVAHSFEESKDQIEQIDHLDVALVDMFVDGKMIGQRIAERIRAHKPDSTIVAISAMPMSQVRPPFNYYLSKPVSAEELIGFLTNIVND